MSIQHTQGKLQAGVSIFQGREVFPAVSAENTQKIVALFGLCGADDEAESIANLLRFVACWNKFHGTSTLTIESMTKPVHEVLFDGLNA